METLRTKRKFFALILSLSITGICFVIVLGFLGGKYFLENQNHKKLLTDNLVSLEEQKDEISIFIQQKLEKQKEDFHKSQEEIEIKNILSNIEKLWNNPNAKIETNPYLSGKEDYNTGPISEVFPFIDSPVVVLDTQGGIVFHANILLQDIPLEDIQNKNQGIHRTPSYSFLQYTLNTQHTVILFKTREYTATILFRDIMYLSLLLIVVGVVLFFLCYLIAKIILKPLEDNIEEMEYFIDNAGHELKTPLAVIQSSGDLMKEMKQYNKQLVGEIVGETKKAAMLIDGLRSLSKLTQKKEISRCNLREIIEDIIQKHTSKNISFSLHGNTQYYSGNIRHLQILFSNIIGNAVKYNCKNGKVDIYFQEYSVSVVDTGVGIPKKEQKKIFTRFYRVKDMASVKSGFGLGLAMVQKICEVYGYKKSIESKENAGTTFTIHFPRKLGKK